MTNREKYIHLCEQESLPLHAQAWWWEGSTVGKEWDAIILENADGQIEAAMPYHILQRFCFRVMLMPAHTQYHYVYVIPKAPTAVYDQLAQAIEDIVQREHLSWVYLQGFYPTDFLNAMRQRGFAIKDRITYRIDDIPAYNALPDLFSANKRRQLKKAQDMQLVDLSVEDFYAFHTACMRAQGKRIDYPQRWAKAVLPETMAHQQGRLIAAQDIHGDLLAAMFLAWDDEFSYFLLPCYHPETKDRGAVAWLTAQALEITRRMGLRFDFEGSMTPSIASSYQQFGGNPTVYHSIERFYNPLFRVALRLATALRHAHLIPAQ